MRAERPAIDRPPWLVLAPVGREGVVPGSQDSRVSARGPATTPPRPQVAEEILDATAQHPEATAAASTMRARQVPRCKVPGMTMVHAFVFH